MVLTTTARPSASTTTTRPPRPRRHGGGARRVRRLDDEPAGSVLRGGASRWRGRPPPPLQLPPPRRRRRCRAARETAAAAGTAAVLLAGHTVHLDLDRAAPSPARTPPRDRAARQPAVPVRPLSARDTLPAALVAQAGMPFDAGAPRASRSDPVAASGRGAANVGRRHRSLAGARRHPRQCASPSCSPARGWRATCRWRWRSSVPSPPTTRSTSRRRYILRTASTLPPVRIAAARTGARRGARDARSAHRVRRRPLRAPDCGEWLSLTAPSAALTAAREREAAADGCRHARAARRAGSASPVGGSRCANARSRGARGGAAVAGAVRRRRRGGGVPTRAEGVARAEAAAAKAEAAAAAAAALAAAVAPPEAAPEPERAEAAPEPVPTAPPTLPAAAAAASSGAEWGGRRLAARARPALRRARAWPLAPGARPRPPRPEQRLPRASRRNVRRRAPTRPPAWRRRRPSRPPSSRRRSG